ncbi:hypothetical protein PG999_014125 [Apiospora kogelbergensis]|uniref:Uncharacterized protein n=1 Tax=Apiospora kogelbergensis TaxID=1337665 RepID=A0AAW0Q863_9PEZI
MGNAKASDRRSLFGLRKKHIRSFDLLDAFVCSSALIRISVIQDDQPSRAAIARQAERRGRDVADYAAIFDECEDIGRFWDLYSFPCANGNKGLGQP